jgi:copper chaperone NosL
MSLQRQLAAILVAMVVFASVPGCSEDITSGPPTIRFGRDECAECGMLISEERCSSAMLVRVQGHPEYLLFDDIGCMLDVESDADREIVDRFVHDHGTQEWTQAVSAWYIAADPDRLKTPMGSGLVAFAQRASAEDAAHEHGGAVKTWKDIREPGDRAAPGASHSR